MATKAHPRHDLSAEETRERRTATIEDYAKEERIRILLVEDRASFRLALAFMLDREPRFEVVEQAGSLAEARAVPMKFLGDVDVALIDLSLSDGDGLDLIKDFSSAPRTVTLVLSASLEPVRFARAVEAGASGVLHKSTPIKDLVNTVRKLRAGEMLRLVSRERQEGFAAGRPWRGSPLGRRRCSSPSPKAWRARRSPRS